MKRLFVVFVLLTLFLSACGSKDQAGAVTPMDVVAAFQAAGLEAEDAHEMTKDDYGMAPLVCEGVRFLVPSLGEDSGGRVFVCSDEKEQQSLADYYISLGKESALFFSWVFQKGNVLVQINGDLDEETARKYEQAIP